MSAGIDYGRGVTNIDPETGIRYGIININRLPDWAHGEFEAVYSAHCPSCGTDIDDDKLAELDRSDCTCERCGEPLNRDDCFGDEPDEMIIDRPDLKAHLDSDGDVWIFYSEWTARGRFCSPCAPGAVYLADGDENGPEAYALGPDWTAEDDSGNGATYNPTALRKLGARCDVNGIAYFGFTSWDEVCDAIRSDEPVYYAAPLSHGPVRLITSGPLDERGRAHVRGYLRRTVRIRPYDCPESSDRFTADASHLNRFLRRAGR